MTLKTHTCHTLVCDECGEDLRPGDEYIAHFDSVENAHKEAAEFYEWTRDGECDLCDQCPKAAECARSGHRTNDNDGWCECCEQFIGTTEAQS